MTAASGARSTAPSAISPTTARIAFSATVALPEVIELDIPQRELRQRARVVWRRNDEVGLSFVEEDHAAEAPATAAEITARIGALEAEIATLRARLASLDEGDAPASGHAA